MKVENMLAKNITAIGVNASYVQLVNVCSQTK